MSDKESPVKEVDEAIKITIEEKAKELNEKWKKNKEKRERKKKNKRMGKWVRARAYENQKFQRNVVLYRKFRNFLNNFEDDENVPGPSHVQSYRPFENQNNKKTDINYQSRGRSHSQHYSNDSYNKNKKKKNMNVLQNSSNKEGKVNEETKNKDGLLENTPVAIAADQNQSNVSDETSNAAKDNKILINDKKELTKDHNKEEKINKDKHDTRMDTD